tara:strand:- start:1768 stop:3507 length:1740 start_codon:yes stop_codon:yes gene_type:complete
MASWKKILVSNTSGDTSTNTGLLNGQIAPSDLAVKWDTDSSDFSVVDADVNSGTGYSAGAVNQVLTISPDDASQLVWKDATTTFTDLTDTTIAADIADGDMIVYDSTGTGSFDSVTLSGDISSVSAAGAVALAGSQDNITSANSMTSASTLATVGTIGVGTWQGTDVGVSHGGTGASDAAGARINLGLVIGTDVQAYNSTLAAVAGGTYTGDDSIDTVGTITTGIWTGTSIADANVANDLTISGGTVNNTPIGASVKSTGAFTTLDSTGNVNIATLPASVINIGASSNNSTLTLKGDTTIKGSLTADGTVNLASGGLTIENSNATSIEDFIVFSGADVTWDGTGTTIDLTMNNISGASAVVPADSYWVETDQEDLFVKVSLASDSASIGTGSSASVTFTIEEWPQYDDDGTQTYAAIKSDGTSTHYLFTQSPAGDIHVTFGDNVIFYGGGVMTSTSNFASTDNIIHLNVVDTNSDGSYDDYSSTADTGIVFGTSNADGADYAKGGKILNTENCFVLATLNQETTVTPNNQDTNSYTDLKELMSKGITFATANEYANTSATPASGDKAIGLVNGVLMAYI